MVWSLWAVTSCRSDLLTSVTPGMNRVKLNLHHFCRIRNLFSSVFGIRGKLLSRPSMRFHVASVTRQRTLSCQSRKSERCVTRLASQQTTRPRKSVATCRPRPASSRPATSTSRPAHLHTPRQTAAPGWVSLLSGHLCQQFLFSSCHVEPVLWQLQAPSEGKKRQECLMKERPATPARNNPLFRMLRKKLSLTLKVIATI